MCLICSPPAATGEQVKPAPNMLQSGLHNQFFPRIGLHQTGTRSTLINASCRVHHEQLTAAIENLGTFSKAEINMCLWPVFRGPPASSCVQS